MPMNTDVNGQNPIAVSPLAIVFLVGLVAGVLLLALPEACRQIVFPILTFAFLVGGYGLLFKIHKNRRTHPRKR